MNRFVTCCAALATGVAISTAAATADLPKPTQEMLKELKFDASMLDGVEEELKVSNEWLGAARKEGQIDIYSTHRPQEWKKISGVWYGRYPDIKLNQQEIRTSTRRYILPLAAFKQGRYLVDVTVGLSGNVYLFRDAGAFADLSDIPTYKNIPEEARQRDHIAVANRVRYWCFSYNTNKVKKEDLPKTWDDLVNSSRFANRKLLIGNRPNNWLLNLWEAKGDEWGKNFTTKLLVNLKPQLRKEAASALLPLVILGEGEMAIPSAMNRVGPQVDKGAPIGFHCPEPVPYTVSELGIFKGAPHVNAAKLWVNWLLSKEGQVAQYWADESVPVHRDLQRKEFVYFPEAVNGKKKALLGDESEKTSVRLAKFWNPLWLQGGGYVPPKPTSVEAKLSDILSGGRKIGFAVKGAKHTASVSVSRTKITVGGKPAKRGALKAGMSCKIAYAGDGGEAKSIDCK